jgi:putative ABC transport system ATP-binding protein
LSRDYGRGDGKVQALKGVSIEVREGELTALMGPSGSGKSTLLQLLGLLDRPTGGRHWFIDREVGRISRDAAARLRNREIGFVFQSFHLLARSTALENVELPLIYAGMRRAARRAVAKQALERVGLAHRADHRPQQLSGGEQQRVAIARALVNEPRLVLADEPTGALDTTNSALILSLLQSLNAQGHTILVVTHDEKVAAHAARVLHLRDGMVVDDVRQSEPATALPLDDPSEQVSESVGASG